MMKISLLNELDTTSVFDLICEDVQIKSNYTTFKDVQSYSTLSVNNYAYSKEDNLFTPKDVKMECVVREEENVTKFKKALRKTGNSFLLKVENFGKVRYAYVKRGEEEIDPIYSKDMYTFTFSFKQFSLWFEIDTTSFTLEQNVDDNSLGYANSDHIYGENEYAYDEEFVYAGSEQTLDTLIVDLPINDSDRGSYVQVQLFNYEPAPKYGLNGRYDSEKVEYAYDSFDVVTNIGFEKLVIDSFPPTLQIEARDDQGNGTNVQEKREFEKSPYLFLTEEYNSLVFTNVYTGRVQLYKLYVQPW